MAWESDPGVAAPVRPQTFSDGLGAPRVIPGASTLLSDGHEEDDHSRYRIEHEKPSSLKPVTLSVPFHTA